MIYGVEVTAMNRSLQFLVESLLPTAACKCNSLIPRENSGKGAGRLAKKEDNGSYTY